MELPYKVPVWLRIAALFFAAYHVVRFVTNWRRARRASRLGQFAPGRVSWLFGFDIIYEFIGSYTRNDVIGFWLRHFRKYGNPANPWTIALGPKAARVIFTAEPENIKAILATQFEEFGKGEEMQQQWHAFLGEGIFTQDGRGWHESRKLIRPQFIKERLSNINVFERHTQDLLARLGRSSGTVNLSKLFFCFSLDAATDFLFGSSVDSLLHERTTFADSFDYIQRTQVKLLSLGPWAIFHPKFKFRRELQALEDFITPYIDQALNLSSDDLERVTQSDTEYTFLHALAAHTRDRKVLRDQIVSVLLAGRDTTACTLSWMFYELSVHPNVVKKLRAEILQQVGPDRSPTYSDLKNMRYLQHVMNETLRLYPVVPYNGRAALCDTTLPRGGGADGNEPIGVLKDTVVNYSTLVMQRREDLYPGWNHSSEKGPETDMKFASCTEFVPERWQDWTPKSWQFVPFNGGPRICIGQQFALTEMAYTVTRILQRYDKIDYMGNGHPGMHADIVLSPAQPVMVQLHKATA